MSIADEHERAWRAEGMGYKAAHQATQDIRQLEADLAEALGHLRHVIMVVDDDEEARAFLQRFDKIEQSQTAGKDLLATLKTINSKDHNWYLLKGDLRCKTCGSKPEDNKPPCRNR